MSAAVSSVRIEAFGFILFYFLFYFLFLSSCWFTTEFDGIQIQACWRMLRSWFLSSSLNEITKSLVQVQCDLHFNSINTRLIGTRACMRVLCFFLSFFLSQLYSMPYFFSCIVFLLLFCLAYTFWEKLPFPFSICHFCFHSHTHFCFWISWQWRGLCHV